MALIAEWTLFQEIEIPNDVSELLIDGERALHAYKTFRDSAIFTDRRIIMRDAQGFSGKKVEIYSIPYSTITMWSSENAGKLLDFTAEIQLWTRAGEVKINLDKKVNVREVDQLIAELVLR